MAAGGFKENASVVDSSLTECKQDKENWDDPGSTSFKENRESYRPRAEERVHSSNGVENLSAVNNDKPYSTRYFIIKSLNHQNIQLSIEKGIWATQVMNEPILEEAFHNSDRVILIFSVNMSGFFQGYAQMISSVSWRRDNVWSEAGGRSNPWGRSFKVKWLRLHDLPFQKTLHLKNPLNDYKPVKISRDCQELSQDIGEALCGLIDGEIDVEGKLRRNNISMDELFKSCINSPIPSNFEEHIHSPSHVAWTRTPMLNPSFLYQHVTQVEANNYHSAHGRPHGCPLLEGFPTDFKVSKGSQMKKSIRGNPTLVQGDRDVSFRLDNGGLSEESSSFPYSITEDDFLEMTYEEYLQVHSRSNMSSNHSAAGPSWIAQEQSSKGYEDNQYSQSLAHRSHSQTRTYRSSHK